MWCTIQGIYMLSVVSGDDDDGWGIDMGSHDNFFAMFDDSVWQVNLKFITLECIYHIK